MTDFVEVNHLAWRDFDGSLSPGDINNALNFNTYGINTGLLGNDLNKVSYMTRMPMPGKVVAAIFEVVANNHVAGDHVAEFQIAQGGFNNPTFKNICQVRVPPLTTGIFATDLNVAEFTRSFNTLDYVGFRIYKESGAGGTKIDIASVMIGIEIETP